MVIEAAEAVESERAGAARRRGRCGVSSGPRPHAGSPRRAFRRGRDPLTPSLCERVAGLRVGLRRDPVEESVSDQPVERWTHPLDRLAAESEKREYGSEHQSGLARAMRPKQVQQEIF